MTTHDKLVSMQRRCKFLFRKRSPPYFLPVTESVSLKKESQPRVDPRPRSGLFVSFFSPLPTKYRLLLYNASIKPLFTYCCTVWSNCSQTNFDELFKLYSPRDARSYDNFGWSTVQAHFGLNTSTLPEQKHYTAYRNPELKQWEHSFIPLLKK